MADKDMSRKELLAPILSAVLGLLSVAALLRLSTGLPAIGFGFLGLRRLNAFEAINSSMQRLGRRLAVSGMVLGAIGCVLGIIALVSMVLLHMGEASRKATCINNLRQIGQAVNLQGSLGSFPRAVVELPPDPVEIIAPWLAEPYSARLSWMVEILPFLDADPRKKRSPFGPTYEKFDRRQSWNDPSNRAGINTAMRLYLCPAHPFFDPQHQPAFSYYVGMAGVGANAAELPRESPHAGFFGYTRRLTRPELIAGESYTMMATETMMDNGPWAAGGRPTLRALDPATQPYIGFERPFGGCHPGGANLLLADGSVRFYAAKGSADVLERLATIHDDP